MADVVVRAGGFDVGGWTSATVRKSIEQVAHEFSLEAINTRPGQGGAVDLSIDTVHRMADTLNTDDEVQILIDGQTVVTGYVDELAFEYDAQSASLNVSGRSKTGDLVDCSAISGTGLWNKATIVQIASDLCSPFGISVSAFVAGVDHLAPFNRFRLEPGETVMEALMRAAETRGVLFLTDADGNLTIERSASFFSGEVLELGTNILRGSVARSYADRHSVYHFKGQTEASDEWSGEKASALEHTVEDPHVGRHRPLVVLGEKQRGKEDVGKRAVFERNVRAGRSERFRYLVEDWTTPTGKLWDVNSLVRVRDPWSEADDLSLLITSAEFAVDANERTTTIELMDRSAFDVLVEPPKRKRRRS